MKDTTILVNLNRCVGCWTCSMACKVGNDLPDEEYWVTVRTLGSGEGIDKPAGTWPNLKMSWMPVWSKSCVKCAPRVAQGEIPYCVKSCPTKALRYGEEAAAEQERLQGEGFRVFNLPAWEGSREGVVYASKQK